MDRVSKLKIATFVDISRTNFSLRSSINNWWNCVSEYNANQLLVFTTCSIFVLCLMLWGLGGKSITVIGINALTSSLVIIVTVILVDKLIQHREYIKSLPIRTAAHRDIQILVSTIISFWHNAFEQAVPMKSPSTTENLFTLQSLDLIYWHLDLESYANVLPRKPWHEYFVECQLDFKARSEQILGRYYSILDPSIYLLIHKMIDKPDPGILLTIGNPDYEFLKRPSILRGYLPIDKNLGNSIPMLIDWCEKSRVELEKHKINGLNPMSNKLKSQMKKDPPPSMIDPDKLRMQAEEFKRRHAKKDKELE